ncbi:MAG: head GIN domain-containing protein [Chthoniobacterales bacterium]
MNTITIRPFAALKLLTFAALSLGGCHWSGIRGNGHIVTDNRPVQDFTGVEAEGSFEIEWVRGASSCTIRTDENLLRHIQSSVDGSKLRLEWDGRLNPTHGVKVKISSGNLNGARLTGAVRLTARSLAGQGFYLDGTGATRVTADGTVNELMATMTGASRLDAESLQVKTAELAISGAGKAEVSASQILKVAISGAGKVTYHGDPTIEQRISGAGSVRKRD